MIYLFEDDGKDPISKLFLASYSEEAKKKMHFVFGSGNLKRHAAYYLDYDDVAVYIDMVPDNESCSIAYNELKKLVDGSQAKHKLYVFPIVCSEYYLIRYLVTCKDVMKSLTNAGICLNKGDYRISNLYKAGPSRCKNFEKFCKYIIIHDVIDCARHSRTTESGSVNSQYGVFYANDCKCKHACGWCKQRSLIEKSAGILMQYDCVPSGTVIKNKAPINDADIFKIHKKLVDEYNAFVTKYVDLGMNVKKNNKGHAKVYIGYILNNGGVK